LERQHRLKIGGESMIGWCIQNRQARIALDVGQEAVRFQNPYLPETHSEMALPLISRDQVIGALTVQSTEQSAFSSEDITLLQTMADQLANAIENARLFAQTQKALSETGNTVPDYSGITVGPR
jgi:GAF domain-containing protein